MNNKLNNRFKTGIKLASDSFLLLKKHPILLAYYVSIAILYILIFSVIYNLIGYLKLNSFDHIFGESFNPPSQNLLADLITTKGGLLYIGYMLSYVLNIIIYTAISFALVAHSVALIEHQSFSWKSIVQLWTQKMPTLIKWAGFVTIITFGANLLSSLPIPATLTAIIVGIFNAIWILITFMVIPVLTFQTDRILESVFQSMQIVQKWSLEIMGGLFWIAITALITMAIPLAFSLFFKNYLISLGIMGIIKIVFTTILLIFKAHIWLAAKRAASQETMPDYSQF